jgi:hypothetical protein
MRSAVPHFLVAITICLSAAAQQRPQPASDIERISAALLGRWTMTARYEPSASMPHGGSGKGEEVWRRGPGGLSLIEDYHSRTTAGENFGIGIIWYDAKLHALQGLWCANLIARGCKTFAAVWDGNHLMTTNQFEYDGKKLVWREMYGDFTPNSFVQTGDVVDGSGTTKRWVTIRARRVPPTKKTPRFNALPARP